MIELKFEIESREDILNVIDKSVPHILLHNFNPQTIIKWWKTDIKIKDDFILKNVSVRNMEMDLMIDLVDLKRFLNLDINYLNIYQFEKLLPDSFQIESLPEHSKEKILKQNGLKHIFHATYEFLLIRSFDQNFIDSIKEKLPINFKEI